MTVVEFENEVIFEQHLLCEGDVSAQEPERSSIRSYLGIGKLDAKPKS